MLYPTSTDHNVQIINAYNNRSKVMFSIFSGS